MVGGALQADPWRVAEQENAAPVVTGHEDGQRDPEGAQGEEEGDRYKGGDGRVHGNGGGPARNGGQEFAAGVRSPAVGEGEAQRRGTRTEMMRFGGRGWLLTRRIRRIGEPLEEVVDDLVSVEGVRRWRAETLGSEILAALERP